MEINICILKNEEFDSDERWIQACNNRNLKYDIVDLTREDWFEKVTKKEYNLFLLRPSCRISKFKKLYDQRLYIISKILNKFTYPNYEESVIYENKELLSYYLMARNIPHPKTKVFYFKDEAVDYLKNSVFPLVGKTSESGSGSGVKILKNISEAERYVNDAFSRKGVRKRFGPNRVTGNPRKWLKKTFSDFSFFKSKIKYYFEFYRDAQRGFVILQEYIPHDFEWRVAKIGESYFGHKKIKVGEKASGSKGIDYVNPPLELLNFVYDICKNENYDTMAIDIFEKNGSEFLVNEMQTIFGHVQDHILEVNGIVGRYIRNGSDWVFESGDFNTTESYDLRLADAIKKIRDE